MQVDTSHPPLPPSTNSHSSSGKFTKPPRLSKVAMKHQPKWINVITLMTTALGLLSGTITQAAEQGKTTGVAAFHAQGAVTEYEPGVGVWLGKFVGVSKTDSGSGPLHNAGWDCTGESVF